jgi:tripartite-type tricarboxylate transporter receptor subunit TctC
LANGGGPAITALLGKNAQTSVQAVSASLGHIKAGKIRALASFGATRSHVLPDVPTLKELGYDVEYNLWVGIFAPHGTPAPVLAALSKTIDQAAASEQYRNAITNSARSSPT